MSVWTSKKETESEIVDDSYISEHFQFPPYRAELFSERTGAAGVMNKNGFNILCFKSNPGAKLASYNICSKIAIKFNQEK